MFPHTITIYHHEVIHGSDVYSKTVLSGFYWSNRFTLIQGGKGVESLNVCTIISNKAMADTFGDEWTVKEGDRIIQGVGDDITSWKQLYDYVTVLGIDVNKANSSVDNIVITGK